MVIGPSQAAGFLERRSRLEEAPNPVFPEAPRCRRPTPMVADENSVLVLPWHSIPLASESRSKPHPHHSFSEHPQPRFAAAAEHSTIEQTQGAIRAPTRVDHLRSDKSRDRLALLPQRW